MQPEPNKVSSGQNMAQPAADLVLRIFNEFFLQFNDMNQPKSVSGGSLPSIMSTRRDEEILERLIQSQRKKAGQRVHYLLHGNFGLSPGSLDGSLAALETDKIWSAFSANQTNVTRYSRGEDYCSWDGFTKSACRGVCRLLKNMPD
ncbi:MAG: hypothetical protein Q9219_006690 [cf. Caloplaca sp. 3 TL-2023]